ncbi:hypothetical protein NQZ68_041870 [Dissostichus eleginoides]|nr:hypothetical protein NQZ68_041870 [Dissostichus eleginoides]
MKTHHVTHKGVQVNTPAGLKGQEAMQSPPPPPLHPRLLPTLWPDLTARMIKLLNGLPSGGSKA